MSGSPVTGAIPVARCEHCLNPVVPCTAPACIGQRAVHMLTRLHWCAGRRTMAYPARRPRNLGGAA